MNRKHKKNKIYPSGKYLPGIVLQIYIYFSIGKQCGKTLCFFNLVKGTRKVLL